MVIAHVLCKKCDRRHFLQLGGLVAAGAVLAACGQSTGEDTAFAQVAGALPTSTSTPAASSTEVQTDAQVLGVACRTGVVNDPYPGHCKHYTDRNGNGYCDLSELGSGSVSPRS
jgi:hypothetical protein